MSVDKSKIMTTMIIMIKTVTIIKLFSRDCQGNSCLLWLWIIAFFQKEGNLKRGKARIQLWDRLGAHARFFFQLGVPPNDPMTERAPTLAPGFHSFFKAGLIELRDRRSLL